MVHSKIKFAQDFLFTIKSELDQQTAEKNMHSLRELLFHKKMIKNR